MYTVRPKQNFISFFAFLPASHLPAFCRAKLIPFSFIKLILFLHNHIDGSNRTKNRLFHRTNAIVTMIESLDIALALKDSHERNNLPSSSAELDTEFPHMNSSMKYVKCLPSNKRRLTTVPLYSKLPVSDASMVSSMSSRSATLQNMHIKFAQEMHIDRRQVKFDSTAPPVPQEESPSTHEYFNEPPTKRMRFQRRNSKTAAMMLSSISSLVGSDFDIQDDSSTHSESQTIESAASIEFPEAWDDSLGVAEELVRQLKLRKQTWGERSAP